MEFINEIYKLSRKFYVDYGTCREILTNEKEAIIA